jgi:hypothetical protein
MAWSDNEIDKVIQILIDLRASLGSVSSGVATEVTLQSIENNTDQIETKLDGSNTSLSEISLNTLALLSFYQGVHTRTSDVVTISGNIPTGAYSISIVASNDFSGTVDGEVFEANETYSEEARLGKTLPQLNYTITAGSLTIRYLI